MGGTGVVYMSHLIVIINDWFPTKRAGCCWATSLDRPHLRKSLHGWEFTYIHTYTISYYYYLNSENHHSVCLAFMLYSEIPLIRPRKIKIFCQLKTSFAKYKLFFSSFSTPSVSLIRDQLWNCPKVVFKTTFGQSQKWS